MGQIKNIKLHIVTDIKVDIKEEKKAVDMKIFVMDLQLHH